MNNEQVKQHRMREMVAEKIAVHMLGKNYHTLSKDTQDFVLLLAVQILSLKDKEGRDMVVVPAEDQSLPECPPSWHWDEREFEAFCAGQNSLIEDGWRKICQQVKSKKP